MMDPCMTLEGEEMPYEVVRGGADARRREEYWEVAKGLQRVDGLGTSAYLEVVQRGYVEGRYTSAEAREAIDRHYNSAEQSADPGQEEADKVSARMVSLLEGGGFTFSPAMLLSIHRTLFDGVLPPEWVGAWRSENISKREHVLGGRSVIYADKGAIEDTLRYDFSTEARRRYSYPFGAADVRNLADFVSGVWQIHPFREGNTRTTAMFVQLYLKSMGVPIDNGPFKEHAQFFRDALVRANYASVREGVSPDPSFLYKFFGNVFAGEQNDLASLDPTCKELAE